MSNKCCIILTTTDDIYVAEKISKSLIDGNLAACVQLEEVSSYFKYEGEFRKEKEYKLTIKASDASYNDIADLICLEHNYDLPQVIKIDIDDGTEEYINWLINKQ